MSRLVQVHLPADAPPGAWTEHPGHLDARPPSPAGLYALRAETGAEPRACVSPLLKGLNMLRDARRDGLPRLWSGQPWTREFYLHFHRLVRDLPAPRLLVLSPPLRVDCPGLEEFLVLYRPFEAELARRRPGVRLLLENRCAETPDEPQPLVATAADLVALGRVLDRNGLDLRLALNLPRLFQAALGHEQPTARATEEILTPLRHCAQHIAALRPFPDPEAFFGSQALAHAALVRLREILDDGRRRFLLPPDDPDGFPGLAALRRAGFVPALGDED